MAVGPTWPQTATVSHSQFVSFIIWEQEKWIFLPIDQTIRMGKEKNVMTCAVFMGEPYVFSKNIHMIVFCLVVINTKPRWC